MNTEQDVRTYSTRPRVAYFTMEIALDPRIPTYSGGLGILAGDAMRSAADLGMPMIAISLACRSGYFRQTIDADGRQSETADSWNPASRLQLLNAKVFVEIGKREVAVAAWLFEVTGIAGDKLPVVLLDTDLHENDDAARLITASLYGGDEDCRVQQEIVLGIGGLRMLKVLGFDISKYHLNEGHAAFLPLELLRQKLLQQDDQPPDTASSIAAVRRCCCFTTHTPVSSGHDAFSYGLIDRLLGQPIDNRLLRELAGADVLNMTQLALSLSDYVNGVARRHAETSRAMFPGHVIHAVTNGVHPATWASPDFAALFDRELPGWRQEPELLMLAGWLLKDEGVWGAHLSAKDRLIAFVLENTGIALDPAVPILGFARRMTAYKRPELLFSDMKRLGRISRKQPFQIVLAGKAHPRDFEAKETIRRLIGNIRQLAPDIRGVFLPDYDFSMARVLIPGVDVWLNTPLPPLEASGTSGMKAALNGVPSLSVPDGWWAEGYIEGVTGWQITETDGSIYEQLEQNVLPRYHQDRAGWIRMMKAAIACNGSRFTSHRMMRQYASEAYL